MTSIIDSLLQFISQHSVLSYFIIFLICFFEALVLIGLVVPGSAFVVALGALLATGILSWEISIAIAIIGAVLGDFASYWIGRRFYQQIARLPPFKKHPRLIERGREFFQAHGGKSVFLGRFVAPLRPVIPLVAGMLQMPQRAFFLYNALSAIAWIIVHVIPGFLLGGSLIFIGSVSARLSILIVVVCVILWLIAWQLLKLINWLVRIERKRRNTLLMLAFLFFSLVWLFFVLAKIVFPFSALTRADQSIHQVLTNLRRPWSDHVFVSISELGDPLINAILVVAVLLILIADRRYRAAIFWIIASLGAACLVTVLKLAFHNPRPFQMYEGISRFSFPSGHATMSAALYGFLLIMVLRPLGRFMRIICFCFAVMFPVLMAFSRIYLGAHWLSDILSGLALGWAWASLIGIFYMKKPAVTVPKWALIFSVPLIFLSAGVFHAMHVQKEDLQRYHVHKTITSMSKARWQKEGYQALPAFRVSMVGFRDEPITFQWAGSAEKLAKYLKDNGWQNAESLSAKSVLSIFASKVPLRDLPIFPKFSSGESERLLMLLNDSENRYVLRLWPSAYQLDGTFEPLWIGTVERQQLQKIAGLFLWPLNLGSDCAKGLKLFLSAVNKKSRIDLRKRPTGSNQCSESVLLIEPYKH